MIATWEGRQAIGSLLNLPTCLLDSASFKVLKADCFRDNPFFLHKIHFAPVDCAMQTYIICVHCVNALMKQGYLYMLPVSPTWSCLTRSIAWYLDFLPRKLMKHRFWNQTRELTTLLLTPKCHFQKSHYIKNYKVPEKRSNARNPKKATPHESRT